jgi:DNA-binding NtrC family response regulator
MRIVAVDDEEENLDLLRRTLGRSHSLRVFNDPNEARDALRNGDFDVLITDLAMPDIDGIALARHARKARSEAIVLLLSAYTDTRDALEAHSEGVVDVMVSKPWTPEQLQEDVRRAILMGDMRNLDSTPPSNN